MSSYIVRSTGWLTGWLTGSYLWLYGAKAKKKKIAAKKLRPMEIMGISREKKIYSVSNSVAGDAGNMENV